jgi:hypothetical protein
MAPKEPKISKQADAGTTTDITFTIPEILEIIRKLGNATCQCQYGSIKVWIVDQTWYNKTQEKTTYKNLGW